MHCSTAFLFIILLMHFEGIGLRLREERERLGLNQDQFAALADTGRMTVYRYEQGSNLPTLTFLGLIGPAGVDVGYLLTGRRTSVALGADDAGLLGRAIAVVDDLLEDHRFHPSEEMRGRLVLQVLRDATGAGRERKVVAPTFEKLISELAG